MRTIRRREFLRTVAGAAAAAGVAPLARAARKDSRPNIVLIMADDMGYSDIGCYGGEIETPNLDRLAAGGLRFSQFYNAARCCPTRASLMTGLYPHQAGVGGMVTKTGGGKAHEPYQGFLSDRCVTIAEALHPAGYSTLMSGKWHVAENHPNWPVDRGFEKYFGLLSGGSNYFKLDTGRKMAIDNEPFTPSGDDYHMTDAFSDWAVKFVDEFGRKDKPFFLYLPYTSPHWPLHAWPKDIAKYRGKYMKGWEQLRKERYARQVKMGLIDKGWPLSPLDAKRWSQVSAADKDRMDLRMAIYAAQIDQMDRGIGKVLDKIKDVGKADNTLVLFLADNGGCHEGGPMGFNRNTKGKIGTRDSFASYGQSWANLSNTPFRMYKHWVHEGGCATPLIAHWPAVIKDGGKITHQVGHIIDVMATCLDLSGATYPKTFHGQPVVALEGKSLVPILKGETRTPHDAIYWEHMGNKAIREGDWKLVSKKGGKWELYDLKADRSELNDLTGKHPDKARQLLAKWETWEKKVGAEKKSKKKSK